MLATEMLLSLLAAIPVQSRFDAPPPGLYNCYSMELTGSVGMPASFRLHPDGRYTSGDRTGMGRYHPNERVMEWKGGIFDGSPPSEYTGWNSSGYTLKVTMLVPHPSGNVWPRMVFCHNHPNFQR